MRIRALKNGKWKVGVGLSKDVVAGDVLDLPTDLATYLLRTGLATIVVSPDPPRPEKASGRIKHTVVDTPPAKRAPKPSEIMDALKKGKSE